MWAPTPLLGGLTTPQEAFDMSRRLAARRRTKTLRPLERQPPRADADPRRRRQGTRPQPPRKLKALPCGGLPAGLDAHRVRACRKIVFLDVDGVLNTDACRPRDAIKSSLLKRWRLHTYYRQKLIQKLESVGVDRCLVVDDTPRLPSRPGGRWPQAEAHRAAEIAHWLRHADLRPGVVWVAVDDLDITNSPHAALFRGHFVRTSRNSGLTDLCRKQLCDILGPRANGE